MRLSIVDLALLVGLTNCVLAMQAELPMLARAPEPTAAPDVEILRRNILKHRAVTADGTRTCGFVSGIASNSLTCKPGAFCSADSSIVGTGTYSNFGCCELGEACTMPLTCYGSSHYWSIKTTLNNYETACPDATAPVCDIYYESGFEAFGCGLSGTTQYVSFVASDGSSPSSATSIQSSPSSVPSSSSPSLSSSAAPSSTTTAPTAAATSTSAIPVPAPVQTSAAAVASTSNGSSTSSLSTGAIVGIAIAAAAVALAAILGIGCVCWQRYRRRQQPAVVQTFPPPSPGPAMASHPGPTPAGHGPAVVTSVEPSSFNSVSQPNKEDYRFSGSTIANEHYGPTGNKIDNMPPLRPVDAIGEAETASNVMSNAGHTVTSVASEGYVPPRV